MRHRALARHSRCPHVKLRSYLIVALAAIAALVAALTFASQSEPAQAQSGVTQARSTDTTAVLLARDKTVAARAVLTAATAARVHAAAVLAAHTYLVRSGDSISGVAASRCGAAKYWTGTYAASRARGWTARNANDLTIGQRLYVACYYDARQLQFAPAPPPPPAPAPATATAVVSSTRTYHSSYHRAYHASYSGSVSPSGSYEACVISRESGGNSQVMNSSGHYGLYQFDLGTWESGGGSAADFGHASPAEQQRVFRAVYAARGTQPWSPSDGC